MTEKMKLSVYEYRCKRCGESFDEGTVYPAKMVEAHIYLICIPDKQEERALKEEYSDDYLGALQLNSSHNCKDGGIGIGELVGCSTEYSWK